MSDMKLCQNFGSQWLAQKTSLMMRVPSVLAPQTYNILINPVHISMKDVQIVSIIRYPFDKRLN
jgi:RES domain-containing protein